MAITTNYSNNVLLCLWGGDISKVKVNTYYLGLSITPINKDGTGISEPVINVGGYARIAIPNTSGEGGSFSAPANSKVSNAQDFDFAKFTDHLSVTGIEAETALRATHWFLADDPTATDSANIKWYGELKNSRPLEIDSVVTFGTGDLTLEFEMPET